MPVGEIAMADQLRAGDAHAHLALLLQPGRLLVHHPVVDHVAELKLPVFFLLF